MTELPVAGYSPEDPNPPNPPTNTADIVSDLADAIKDTNSGDPTNVRVGAITAVESASPFRVRLDITGTAWLSRTADAALKVGDRVWAVQQGEVIIVGGRLNSIDAFTPIGTLLPYAGSSTALPTGWLLCDGSAVSRTTYAALFAVCGTTYGAGNGTSTFNVPNLTNRVPVGAGGSYSRGTTGGTATVTLTESQMPSHDHTLSGTANSAGSHSHGGSTGSDGSHSHSGDGGAGSRSDLLASGGSSAATPGAGSTGSAGGHSHGISTDSSGSHTHSLSGSVGSAGSDAAHENMPPFVAVNYIIRAT